MQKVFGYVRVSTAKQGLGASLVEQRDAISRFAARNDLEIVRWFEETQTAAKRGRRAFSEILRKLGRGEVAGVIIHKIDRGARNLRDWADLGELIDAGIRVYIASDNLDLRSRGGRLTADIQAVVAADFIRNNREEVKKGLVGRLKQGLWPYRAPVGYLDRGRGQPKAVDPQKAPLIREVFELYRTRRFTIETLVEEMATRGLRNQNGRPFSMDGLWVILRNPFYVGTMRIRRTGEVYAGVHEPILSRAIFDEVQDILDGRGNVQTTRNDFLFRRCFRCATCGRALTGSLQKGHVYYRCHTKTCATTSVREEVIERSVTGVLERISFPLELRATLRFAFKASLVNAAAAAAAQRASLQASIAAVDSRLGRLTDALIDGTLENDLFISRKTALLAERARLRDQMAAQDDDGEALAKNAAEKLQLAESAIYQYKLGSVREKRLLLDRVSCNRVGSGKQVDISLLPPLAELAELTDSGECAHYRESNATSRERYEQLFELATQLLNVFGLIPDRPQPDLEA